MKLTQFLTAMMFVIAMPGCRPAAVDEPMLPADDPGLNSRQGALYLSGKPFTGTIYRLDDQTHDTVMVSAFSEGLQHGVTRLWYARGKLQEYRVYLHGRKHGPQQAWWPNGHKKFEFTAVSDAYEGELKEWDIAGQLFHLAHFVNGQEAGVQQLWYDNGKIRANYVMIRGRRYGLLGTKNCKNVSDSIFNIR